MITLIGLKGLYVFLCLGKEVVLVSLIEPKVFKLDGAPYTVTQNIVHWIAAMLIGVILGML